MGRYNIPEDPMKPQSERKVGSTKKGYKLKDSKSLKIKGLGKIKNTKPSKKQSVPTEEYGITEARVQEIMLRKGNKPTYSEIVRARAYRSKHYNDLSKPVEYDRVGSLGTIKGIKR